MQSPIANQYWLDTGRVSRTPSTVFGAWLYHDRTTRMLTVFIYSALSVSLSLILTVCLSVFVWQYPADMARLRDNVFLQMVGD